MRIPFPRSRTGRLAALAIALGALVPLFALSVNNNNVFELDGDASDGAPAGEDWDLIAAETSTHALASRFITDPVGDSNDETFTGGGSKDVRDTAAGGLTSQVWQHQLGEPPDKDDIGHAFAAAYTDPVTDHLFVYFGADRFSNSGDSAIGFWFFKNAISTGPNGKFSGIHSVGDVLVTSDFRKGGSASVINVFVWTGNAANPLQLKASATAGGSGGFFSGDLFCANPSAGNTTPLASAQANKNKVPVPDSWTPVAFKGLGEVDQFQVGTFFEGGVDLNQVVGNGALPCFSSFLVMTRTSASTTAQLKDFALGDFTLCGMSVGKACVREDGVSPVVNADGVSVHTRFKVPVSNTGIGTLSDIRLTEKATLGGDSGNSCRIASVDIGAGEGTPAVPAPDPAAALATDAAVKVAATLTGGSTIDVYVECDTLDNPFLNAVEIGAKTSPGLAAPDLIRTHTIELDSGEDCKADASPMIDVSKSCKGVKLVYDSGHMQPKVCFDIEISNTGKEQLKGLVVNDDKMGGALALPRTYLGPQGSATDSILLSDQCFTPDQPDGAPPPEDPQDAKFNNLVTASATGAVSLKEASENASDDCYLCPQPE
jgi:hypothetical protein